MTLALFFKAPDHSIHIAVGLRTEQSLGLIDHLRIKTKASGNGQSIAASGDPPKQLIRRRQRLAIEGDGSVFEAVIAVFESFELAEVGGGDREASAIRQRTQKSRCQSRSLAGIGTRTHLIEQHQGRGRAFREGRQDAGDALHMATKRGQTLLKRLFIANVSKHLGTPGEGRRPCARQPHTGARHQRRQSDALEGDGFATGVGPRDGHHPQLTRHRDADGHHSSTTLTLFLPNQKWMAQLIEGEGRLRVRLKFGRHTAKPLAIAGTRQGEVEHQQHISELDQRLVLGSHRSTEFGKHPLFFLADPPLLTRQTIPQVNHRLGLHKHCVPRSGTVMHHAFAMADGTGLHSQNGPAMTLGDHRVLQLRRPPSQHLLQTITSLLAQALPLKS